VHISSALCRQYVTSGQNKTVFCWLYFYFISFFGCQTFYDNLFDYFLVKVQTLSYSLCSQLAQLLSLFLLFRAIFLVGLVKVYAWCMKNSRRKRKCCTTYAPVRSFVSHIYVWTSLCLHKCEQINFIAYFLAPHDGAANGLASAIYMVSYAILILKSLLFFFCTPASSAFFAVFPALAIQSANKWNENSSQSFSPSPIFPRFFSVCYLPCGSLVKTFVWHRQYPGGSCGSPLTFAFVWIFQPFLISVA